MQHSKLIFMISILCFTQVIHAIQLTTEGITFPDGSFQSSATKPQLPKYHIWVAKEGGDYINPVDAINAMDEWCPRPPVEKCVIHLAAGNFSIGANSVYLKRHMSILGQGQKTTTISGNPEGAIISIDDSIAADITIRDLTIQHEGETDSAVGISHTYPDGIVVENVDIQVRGGQSNTGIWAKARCDAFSSMRLSNVNMSVTGGIFATGISACYGGSASYRNLIVNVGYADEQNSSLRMSNARVKVADSEFYAREGRAAYAIDMWGGSAIEMRDVVILAENSGNAGAIGIKNQQSSLEVSSSSVEANNLSASGTGIQSVGSVRDVIIFSTISASSYGVSGLAAASRISHSTIGGGGASILGSDNLKVRMSELRTPPLIGGDDVIDCKGVVVNDDFYSDGCAELYY